MAKKETKTIIKEFKGYKMYQLYDGKIVYTIKRTINNNTKTIASHVSRDFAEAIWFEIMKRNA